MSDWREKMAEYPIDIEARLKEQGDALRQRLASMTRVVLVDDSEILVYEPDAAGEPRPSSKILEMI